MILSSGYISFIRRNPAFRRFWFAAVISWIGEWFNTIALFFLILEYSGSEFLLGALFSVRMALFAISQPIIGVLADRINRKKLMIFSNVVQIGLALSFILVDGEEDMWWLIAISGIMMLLHGFYVTAERAALPNIVDEGDLLTANAIDSASWSASLCIGAMLGGIVVSNWGTDVAFVLDSMTFLVGALVLLPMKIPQTIDENLKGPIFSTAFQDIKTGWDRIRSDPRLLRLVFAKSAWNLAGAGLAGVFLVLAGGNLDGYGAAFGFGLFFFARGIGTGVGPLAARVLFKDQTKWPALIGLLVSLSGIFYFFVGLSLTMALPVTIALIILAHAASGANWILSTVLTQMWVEDEVRGRVFSMDMLVLGASAAISTTVAGFLVENYNLALDKGMMMFSLVMIFSGLVFTFWRPDLKQVIDTGKS
ncbi:MAG: MFS transporter [Euryarchaeota archaeon]|jgi:MFS family permease|nr:MFS transporter [Euryarchaeota archaeon]MBT5736690.1 MFS transporter [Euryarchaeota archaeon]MBT7460021.1 MFS transporter [Euryarchaeota archaeon]